MKLKVLVTLCAALAGGSAMADSCSSTSNFGNMGPPGFVLFGNSFDSAGSFNDCYTFSLNSAADSFGGVIEIDPWLNSLDIDVSSVSLFFGSNLVSQASSPWSFGFGSLAAGDYTLAVAGQIGRDPGFTNASVFYGGSMATVAAAVPEPETYAMMLAGLFGVGAVARRRKAA
jgi:PEP-CTERM motif